jgi:hypothetical protein
MLLGYQFSREDFSGKSGSGFSGAKKMRAEQHQIRRILGIF